MTRYFTRVMMRYRRIGASLLVLAVLFVACGGSAEPLSDTQRTWCRTVEAAVPLEAAFNALRPDLDPDFVSLFLTMTQAELQKAVDTGGDVLAAYVRAASLATTSVQQSQGTYNEHGEREYARLCRAAWEATRG